MKYLLKARARNEGEVWTQPSGRVVTKKKGIIVPVASPRPQRKTEDNESKKEKKQPKERKTNQGKEIIRTGTPVVAEYRGKEIHGKVVGTKSIGKKGTETQGAATHYIIEYKKAEQSTGDERGAKGREKLLTINVNKDKVRRKATARKERTRLEADDVSQERLAKQLSSKVSGALTRLSAKDSQEFHDKAKELIGNFWDNKNPIHKVVAKKVASVVAGMTARGMNPMADLSHKNLMEVGLSGVYQAILDYNPEKGATLKTFLQSDKVKDYITTELKDALMVERGVIHKMSWDTKKAVALMKQLKDEMGQSIEGLENKEIIHEYEKRYGNKKNLNLKKVLDLVGTRRVSNIVESMDESGEISHTDRQASTVKTPEEVVLGAEKMNALPKKMESAMKGRLPKGVSAKAVADIMQYRYRIDESTTGKGVYGERSIYYKNPSDAAAVEGKRLSYTQDKDGSPVRSWEEVAKRYGTSKAEAEALFNHGAAALKTALKENDKNAKELVSMMFNKSKEWRRKDLREWLMKSNKNRTVIIRAQRMLFSIIG